MQSGKLEGISDSYIQSAHRSLSVMADALSDLEANPSDRSALASLERIASGFRQMGNGDGYPEINGLFSKIAYLLRDGAGFKSELNPEVLTRIGQVIGDLGRLLNVQLQSVQAPPFSPDEEKGKDAGNLLIVDPDPQGRESARAILEGCGYRVETAESGGSAMGKELKNMPDLILVDLSFSRAPREMAESIDFIKKLRKLPAFSQGRIIAVSSMAAAANSTFFAFSYEIDDIIAKPYRQDELVSRIRNQLQKKRREEQLISEKEAALQAGAELEKKLNAFQWQLDSLRKERDNLQIKNNQLEKRNRTLIRRKSFSKTISWFMILLLISALAGALVVASSGFFSSFYNYMDKTYQPMDIDKDSNLYKLYKEKKEELRKEGFK